jgi:hypothetical protein
MIPILNKTYYTFDDGKIRPSRRHEVVITEIIPFNEIDQEILDKWKNEVNQCDWLYRETTDYFIKAEANEEVNGNVIDETLIFVRSKNDGWFSLGFWGGRLDVDGTLNAFCEENFKKTPKQQAIS